MDELLLLPEEKHGALTGLYRAAGLEIGDDWIEENRPVYSVAARRGETLLGAATVSRRFRRLVLDYLAVKPEARGLVQHRVHIPAEARGLGLGKALTEKCVCYARQLGETALWIAAREPDFYQKLGAKETEDDALLEDCRRCPDYRKNCLPKELVFDLKETP